MTTLQDLIDYANEHGFDPCDCVIKAQNFDNGHLYDVTHDQDEIWEPMIVLGYFPEN